MIPDDLRADPLLLPAEVAALLGVSPVVVTRWARAGRLPALRPGGHYRIRTSDAYAALEANEEGL